MSEPFARIRITARAVALALALVAAAGRVTHPARAGEALVDPATGTSMFSNLKALGVGDVVTIIIRESAVASSNAKTESNNKQQTKGGPGAGLLGFMDLWGLDFQNKYSGDGKTERTGSLVTEMTARIVERLPNRQFRVEGRRTVRINGEFQTVVVSGIVRERDIDSNNQVLSTRLADATIVYEGHGDVGRASSPGLFTKIVDFLF